MTRKCPFSGEQFVPKRRNQVFASAKNRRDYHNEKAASLRRQKAPIDKALEINYKILSARIKPKTTVTIKKEELRSMGFNPSVFTHFKSVDGATCHCLYNFVFLHSKDNDSYLIKALPHD